jgi:uncharacterized membrane protein
VLGYDWARLHAALNDLPAALLLFAVLFDFLGPLNRRETLKTAGFWCLIAGVTGGLLAAGAGLMAEDVVEHSARAHTVMETHKTLALVSLSVFAALLLWRLRRRTRSRKEETVFLTVGAVGVILLVWTAKLGGTLVFDHGLGISTRRLDEVIVERAGGHEHEEEHAHPAPSGQAGGHPAPARADSTHR